MGVDADRDARAREHRARRTRFSDERDEDSTAFDRWRCARPSARREARRESTKTFAMATSGAGLSAADALKWLSNFVSSVAIVMVNKQLMGSQGYAFQYATTLCGMHFFVHDERSILSRRRRQGEQRRWQWRRDEHAAGEGWTRDAEK